MLSQLLNRKRQSGMVLVTGLIFLLLMTVLGMTSVQTTTLNERMASNANDRNVAFQAAEIALRRAETVIMNTEAENINEIPLASVAPDSDDDNDWTDAISYPSAVGSIPAVSSITTVPPLAAQPTYVIQCAYSESTSCSENCFIGMNCYKVTARGQGAIATSVVVLETIVARPID
ncbi:pilus assembly PilX family protein [Chromatium okenii]|nr:PilX N-terminal domain-containing pilus assembly protein [Chromatium okenii]